MLEEHSPHEVDPPRQDFAERLAQWLGAADAVRLHAALPQGPVADIPHTLAANALALHGQAAAEVARVRTALSEVIAAQAAQALRDAPPEAEAGHTPHRQRHAESQRQMALKIGPLRASVRQLVAQASPWLRQLALLDAALEHTLGAREPGLMASVPWLLERRCEHTRRAQPPGWHTTAANEVQTALQAELEFRLQPVMGLLQAWHIEIEKHA
jgi:hypothetical protein